MTLNFPFDMDLQLETMNSTMYEKDEMCSMQCMATPHSSSNASKYPIYKDIWIYIYSISSFSVHLLNLVFVIWFSVDEPSVAVYL